MNLVKAVSLYSLIGFLNPAINFFLAPFLSRYLTPEDYGLVSLFNTYITLMTPVISLLAFSVLSVEYYKEKSPEVFASKFVSIQIIPVVNFLILGILSWFCFDSVSGLMELKGLDRKWGVIILLVAFLGIYIETLFSFLIIAKKVVLYTVFSLVRLFVETGLTIYLIVYSRQGWEGRINSALLTSVLLFIIAILYFKERGYLKAVIRKKYIIEGIRYGLPLILHTIGKVVINQSDRLFIAKMEKDVGEVGVYTMGYNIGMVVLITVTVLSNVLTPFIYERLANLTEHGKIQIVRMSYLFALATLLVLLALMPVAWFMFDYLIDPSYSGGRKYVFWTGLSYFFWGCYLIFCNYVFYYGKTTLLARLAILSIICNAAFNYIFIGQFGPIGASYATTLSFLIISVIVAFSANKLIRLPWFDRRIFQFKRTV